MTGIARHGAQLTDDGRGAVLTFGWDANPIPANGSRGSFRAHARRVRETRAVAAGLARIVRTADRQPLRFQHAEVELIWYPTVARRRDAHNLVPLLKALVDGLVSAELIPDDNDEVLLAHMPRIVLQPDGPARFELTVRATEGDHR